MVTVTLEIPAAHHQQVRIDNIPRIGEEILFDSRGYRVVDIVHTATSIDNARMPDMTVLVLERAVVFHRIILE